MSSKVREIRWIRNLLMVGGILLVLFYVNDNQCGVVEALPVSTPKNQSESQVKEKPHGNDNDAHQNEFVGETALEYDRYLREVVQTLESDPDFRKKLDEAPEADIRNGKIAQELDYVNHSVRTKLDEIKRRELERLRELAKKEYELMNEIDRGHMKIPQHLDHNNEHTFEIEDLRKLIKKTSDDLAETDRKRREEFKEYEMQKEFEREMLAKEMNNEQREKYLKEQEELKEKHKKHEKVHYPGHKAQLEEVWTKQDHMEPQDFQPKTFFMMHDVDGNGFWDEAEVKALFINELNKVYEAGMKEDDMRERAEEMERMREFAFKEVDVDRDGLISFQEFIDQTKRDEFNRDPSWQTVDAQPQYTHEEYLEFERRRKAEVDRLIAQGLIPPHPNMPQGYSNGPQMHYEMNQNMVNQQQYQHQQPQQQYHHPQQHPQQYQQNPQFHQPQHQAVYPQQHQLPEQSGQFHHQEHQQQQMKSQAYGAPNQKHDIHYEVPHDASPRYQQQQQQLNYQQQQQQVHLNSNQIYQTVAPPAPQGNVKAVNNDHHEMKMQAQQQNSINHTNHFEEKQQHLDKDQKNHISGH